MKSTLTIVISLLLTTNAFATQQRPDKLIYDGKQYRTNSRECPYEQFYMEDYFKKHPEKRPRSGLMSTALYRGYVATYEIKDSQLVLSDIEIRTSHIPDEWKSVKHNIVTNNTPFVVDWFTGVIVLHPFDELVEGEARTPERCGHEHIHGAGPCRRIAADFEKWLTSRRDGDRPLFAQVNFFEPHRPFPHDDIETLSPDGLTIPRYLPDIPEVREDLAAIEASIASADKAFGQIVEAVRSSESAARTLILFTADHGIAFPHAKMTLYDPGIEVPLLIAVPGIAPGTVRDELISNVDVMPTLLELVSLPVPSNLHGRSFAGLLANKPYTPNSMVFTEKTYHTYYDPMRAVRTKKWKLIANFEFAPWQETSPDYKDNAKCYVEVSNALKVPYDIQYHPAFEFYDIETDPCEQHNLADDPTFSAHRNTLIQALYTWMVKTSDPLLDGPMAQGAYRERMRSFKDIGQQPSSGDASQRA